MTTDFYSPLSPRGNLRDLAFHVFPVVFISASIGLLHVSRGRPRFLFPLSAVRLSAVVLLMLSRSLRITCLSHLHLSCLISDCHVSLMFILGRTKLRLYKAYFVIDFMLSRLTVVFKVATHDFLLSMVFSFTLCTKQQINQLELD